MKIPRSRLTLAEAASNHLPEKFTSEEWKAMEVASGQQFIERVTKIVEDVLDKRNPLTPKDLIAEPFLAAAEPTP